jgi:hypothetical protein
MVLIIASFAPNRDAAFPDSVSILQRYAQEPSSDGRDVPIWPGLSAML